MNETTHMPVLLREVLAMLSPQEGETALDATAGGGGHAAALCDAVGESGFLVALDRDDTAVERVRSRLEPGPCRPHVIHGDFKNAAALLREAGADSVDCIVLDLGMSSDQLERSGRGFSLRREEEPLDMRFDAQATELTAADIVNTLDADALRTVLLAYGEERFARPIAEAIVRHRSSSPIATVGELVEALRDGVPQRFQYGRLHFATKTFQALRIMVNDELSSLETGLNECFSLLTPGGRMAVISFHGGEDKIVKNFFREQHQGGTLRLLTKKPIIPSEEESTQNPRARSAKLRGITKL